MSERFTLALVQEIADACGLNGNAPALLIALNKAVDAHDLAKKSQTFINEKNKFSKKNQKQVKIFMRRMQIAFKSWNGLSENGRLDIATIAAINRSFGIAWVREGADIPGPWPFDNSAAIVSHLNSTMLKANDVSFLAGQYASLCLTFAGRPNELTGLIAAFDNVKGFWKNATGKSWQPRWKYHDELGSFVLGRKRRKGDRGQPTPDNTAAKCALMIGGRLGYKATQCFSATGGKTSPDS